MPSTGTAGTRASWTERLSRKTITAVSRHCPRSDQGHPSSCDGHRVDLDAVQRSRYIAMGCSRIRQAQLSHWIQPGHRSRTRP